MPSHFETIDFNSCYSHWKLNPKPSSRKSSKKGSFDCDESADVPNPQLPKFLQALGPKVRPKIELKAPKCKKSMKNKRRQKQVLGDNEEFALLSQHFLEQGRAFPSLAESPSGVQISFTEVVINSMEDFKKMRKETSTMKKSPVWNAIPSTPCTISSPIMLPATSELLNNNQPSAVLLQQILKEEKKFDDAVQQQTRAVLESIQENRFARAMPAMQVPLRSLRSTPGVAFPLSRIPSLEKLQSSMQLNPATTAGHNISSLPMNCGPSFTDYGNFKGHSIPIEQQPASSINSTHVPLSTGRTTSFEKMLSYWRECADPIDSNPMDVNKPQLSVADFSTLEDLPMASFEEFLSDDSPITTPEFMLDQSNEDDFTCFQEECHSPDDLQFVEHVLTV